MARRAVGLTVTNAIIGSEGFRASGHVADPVNTVSTTDTAAALADVVADVAVLVADGASPTQAHVTTLDGHLTTLNAAWAALLAGTGGVPTATDIVVSYDTTNVASRSILRRGIDVLLTNVEASDDLVA